MHGLLNGRNRPALFAGGYLAFIFLLYWGLREPQVEATDPEVSEVADQVWYRGRPLSGTLLRRNLHQDPLELSHYHHGQKQGVSLTFHHDGTRVARSWFEQGRKNGRQETWYPDGRRRAVSFFRAGVADGLYSEWHPNGKLYRQQRIEAGVEKERRMYYESGVIYSNYVRREGRTYGIEGEPLCSTGKQEGFK